MLFNNVETDTGNSGKTAIGSASHSPVTQ
uniref:Uncharacterized protein n=1 Tax=Anguilla anguilla TaxID=7936 RepID=A0A0E9UI78_ANGAN